MRAPGIEVCLAGDVFRRSVKRQQANVALLEVHGENARRRDGASTSAVALVLGGLMVILALTAAVGFRVDRAIWYAISE